MVELMNVKWAGKNNSKYTWPTFILPSAHRVANNIDVSFKQITGDASPLKIEFNKYWL